MFDVEIFCGVILLAVFALSPISVAAGSQGLMLHVEERVIRAVLAQDKIAGRVIVNDTVNVMNFDAQRERPTKGLNGQFSMDVLSRHAVLRVPNFAQRQHLYAGNGPVPCGSYHAGPSVYYTDTGDETFRDKGHFEVLTTRKHAAPLVI